MLKAPLVARLDPSTAAVSAPAALDRGPRAWQLGEGPLPVRTAGHILLSVYIIRQELDNMKAEIWNFTKKFAGDIRIRPVAHARQDCCSVMHTEAINTTALIGAQCASNCLIESRFTWIESKQRDVLARPLSWRRAEHAGGRGVGGRPGVGGDAAPAVWDHDHGLRARGRGALPRRTQAHRGAMTFILLSTLPCPHRHASPFNPHWLGVPVLSGGLSERTGS